MMTLLEFFSLLGGVGLFLFGMTIMSSGLKNACGDNLQNILEKATKNKVIAVIIGVLMTMLIQSSSATDVMVIGFVSSGMMTLSQAIGVIMGTNIGTSDPGTSVQQRVERAADRRGHRLNGPGGVDDDNAPRLGVRQGEELLAQSGAEGVGLALEAVPAPAPARAAVGEGRVGVEQDGPVRQKPAGGPQGQVPDLLGPEGAGRALVGDGGVEVAVGDDDGAALQGGANEGGDVVGAVGGVQEGLGARVDVVAVEQQATDLGPQGGAARLAGDEDLDALGPESFGEDAGLGGLADAVAPFEGEEEARAVGGVPRGRGGGLAHAASVVAGRRCSPEWARRSWSRARPPRRASPHGGKPAILVTGRAGARLVLIGFLAPPDPSEGGKRRPGRIVPLRTRPRRRHNRAIMRKSSSTSDEPTRTILPERHNREPGGAADRPARHATRLRRPHRPEPPGRVGRMRRMGLVRATICPNLLQRRSTAGSAARRSTREISYLHCGTYRCR